MKPAWILAAAAAFLAACSQGKREAAPFENRPDGGLVEIGMEAQKHFGMRIETVRMHDLQEYLQVPGTVQPADSRVNVVRPLARGRLHEVLVRVGDRVHKGQLLARYDNIEAGESMAQLAGAKAELERLRAQERNLARQAARARALADIGAVPGKEVEQADADRESAKLMIRSQESAIAGIQARLARFGVAGAGLEGPTLTGIASPLAGVVTKQDASPGAVIDAGAPLFTVAGLSVVWVQAEVYEKDLSRVRVGRPAFISVDTYPNQAFTGKVTYVSDFLDPQTRTAKVRCEVPNEDMRLKLDMYANVRLPAAFNRRTLAVPAGAVQDVGGAAIVFVRKTATRFEPRRIAAGNRVGDLVEIARGLAAGEPVVVAGAFHLKSILVAGDLGEE